MSDRLPLRGKWDVWTTMAGELRRRGPRTLYAYAHTFLPERFHGARDRRYQFRDSPTDDR